MEHKPKLKELWPELTIYERFEYLVTLFVGLLLSVIILVALVRLTNNVYDLVMAMFDGPLEFKVFQTTFGMLLTLLIAMEFRNSLNAILERKGLLFQVRVVVLIAIVALARKFLVLDPKEYSAGMIAAFAGVTVALGGVYWLLYSLGDKGARAREKDEYVSY